LDEEEEKCDVIKPTARSRRRYKKLEEEEKSLSPNRNVSPKEENIL
jgi:hypothetical protein